MKGKVFFLMIFFSTQLVVAQTRSITVQDVDVISPGIIYENSWAIIVGIDRYSDQRIDPLSYAVADAEAISELIQKYGFPEENIALLTNEEATRINFIQTFTELSEKTGENDRILVYWAGHGETEQVAQGDEGYLIPYDADLDGLAYSALSMDILSSLSRRPKAKHQLFLVDACYGGLAANKRSSGTANKPNQFMLDVISNAKAIQIITAGGKDQVVVESPQWGHSAFTKAFIEALDNGYADFNRDNLITADELYTFLRDRVVNLSSSVSYPHYPVRHRFDNAEGEFMFILNDYSVITEEENAQSDPDDRFRGIETGFPDWFLNPPFDTEDQMFATSSGVTDREAIVSVLNSMASKISSKVEASRILSEESDEENTIFTEDVFRESSSVTVNQFIGNLNISSLTKIFTEEISRNGVTSYSSNFSQSIKVLFTDNRGKYEFRFYEEEVQSGDDSVYNVSGSDDWFNLRFDDMVLYIHQLEDVDLLIEKRVVSGEVVYFAKLSLDPNNIPTGDSDLDDQHRLYEMWKRSMEMEENRGE